MRKRTIRRAASNITLVCLLIIAALSAYKLFDSLHSYKQDREAYNKIQEIAVTEDKGIDFDKLYEVNPDVIGWLVLDDTIINYPIVQGTDNEKYLHTLFDGSPGSCGTLFADCRNEQPFKVTNTVIYGHHMRDGSMFNVLKEFRASDYARSHGVFTLYTPEKEYELLVVAFLQVDASDDLYDNDWANNDSPKEWIKRVQKKAQYLTGEEMGENDSYVMLSTCVNATDSARFVVIGKLEPRK